jgi:Uma2 family endonuclease
MAVVKKFRRRMTYADLEQMPDDGRRFELYDGEARVVPSPIPLHQLVAHRLANEFEAYQQNHGGIVFLSPLDIVFSEVDCVQPDVVFFEHTRRHLIDLRKAIRVAPDLAVEVLSPGTARIDRGKKMRMFAKFGVREYWLVDPDAKTIEVYRLTDTTYVLAQRAAEHETAQSTILPAFAVKVTALLEFEH